MDPAWSLGGLVINDEGLPIRGARICDSGEAVLATSDARGTFHIDEVSLPETYLKILAEGYESLALTVTSGRTDLRLRLVPDREEASIPEEEIMPESPPALVIRVVDADGRPAASRRITVDADAYGSDADGRVSHTFFPPYGAKARLRVAASEASPGLERMIDLPPPGRVEELLVTLPRGVAITFCTQSESRVQLTPGPHRLLPACEAEIRGATPTYDQPTLLFVTQGEREVLSCHVQLPHRLTNLPPGPLRFALRQGGTLTEIDATLTPGAPTVLDLSPGRPRVLTPPPRAAVER